MNHSESVTDLVTALSKAQGKFVAPIKDSTNPHFKSKYADLASVIDSIRDPMSTNGLSYTQSPHYEGDKCILITTIFHSSGQKIVGHMPIICSKNDAQGFGSALTYARRYSLMSMLGLAPDDDDGNAASSPNTKQVRTEPKKFETQVIKREQITAEQFEELNDLIGENHEYRNDFMARLYTQKINKLEDLPKEWFDKALAKAKADLTPKVAA